MSFMPHVSAASDRSRTVIVTPVGALILEILSRYPKNDRIAIVGGYRPHANGSHHAGLNHEGSRTAAIDVAADRPVLRDLAAWLSSTCADALVELHYVARFGEGVRLHIASSAAQAARVLERLQSSSTLRYSNAR